MLICKNCNKLHIVSYTKIKYSKFITYYGKSI
jgi:hypothetical protein